MIRLMSEYFLLFYFYSIVGYFCEILSIYRLRKKIVWNRGYLLGPYLPIFGFGALIITIFLNSYQNNPLTLFILGMVYCGTLEYFTSLILEKIFHLRWWDYSKKKFNINGRICLETSTMFGLGAIILVNFSNEILLKLIRLIPNHVIIPIAIVIFIIMLVDVIISTVEIFRLKNDIILVGTKDATQEIKRKIKESLEKNYYYYERLFKAFPNIHDKESRIEEIKNRMEKLKIKRDKDEK